MEVREFIRQRRKAIKISQAELADRLSKRGHETSDTRISHWETGRNRPPLENKEFRYALAAALEMDVNEMMKTLEFVVSDDDRSKAARVAADIVDHLPPQAQDLALDYLRVLEKRFTVNA